MAAATVSAAAGATAGTSATRRVWVRDRSDAMRWRPGCLVPEGETSITTVATTGGSGGGGGGGASEVLSGYLVRLDDGNTQVWRSV